MEITTHLDHISHCKTASDTNWSNRWTCRVFIIHTRRDEIHGGAPGRMSNTNRLGYPQEQPVYLRYWFPRLVHEWALRGQQALRVVHLGRSTRHAIRGPLSVYSRNPLAARCVGTFQASPHRRSPLRRCLKKGLRVVLCLPHFVAMLEKRQSRPAGYDAVAVYRGNSLMRNCERGTLVWWELKQPEGRTRYGRPSGAIDCWRPQ